MDHQDGCHENRFSSNVSNVRETILLVKETESHVVVLFFGLLGGGRSSGGSRSRISRGGRRRGGGKSARICQIRLDRLGLLEGDLGDGRNGQQVLHAVDDGMWHGGHGGVADLQADGGHVGHALHEGGLDVVVADVQDLGVEHGAVVIHLLENETIAEGGNLEHVQEGSLGHTHPVTSCDQGHIRDDLNGTLGNLGGDAQGLEEGGLLGTHAGVLGGHHHVQGGQGAGLGGGLHLVGQQHVPDLGELLVGEHEADILLDVG